MRSKVCEDLCDKLSLPLKCISKSKARRAMKWMGLARRLRLEALEESFSSFNIYMAHHKNDLEETFLRELLEVPIVGGFAVYANLLDWGN